MASVLSQARFNSRVNPLPPPQLSRDIAICSILAMPAHGTVLFVSSSGVAVTVAVGIPRWVVIAMQCKIHRRG